MAMRALAGAHCQGVLTTDHITYRNIARVLIAGFGLVILLLVLAGAIAIRNTQAIRERAAELEREQALTTRLIDEIQHEQATLNAVFYNLGLEPDAVDPESLLSQLDQAVEAIRRTVSEAEATPEKPIWSRLSQATLSFSAEARRLLSQEEPSSYSSAFLLTKHEQVISLVVKLIAAGHRRAVAAQEDIERRSERLLRESAVPLGACILAALVCALLTVRMTGSLFRKMEWQAGELSRVSWHMLESQETTARRFSHELHDELGQSLTAVKANLHMLGTDPAVDRAKLADTTALVDEAIRNVRELSQLLRPTILDDLGLDAGLRSLTERFMQRTGIEVEYVSDFSGRLRDEKETHLFRIAQEALTNIARHSGATKVAVELCHAGGSIRLRVRDNGKGLPAQQEAGKGLGMIGMRARARGAGGELRVGSAEGGGVALEATVPCEVVEVAPHERRFSQQ